MHRISLLAALLLPLIGTGAHADEVTLSYQGLIVTAELNVPDGKSLTEGPLILMTHGTLAHGRMEIMQTLQDLFAQRGYASLALNLSLGQDKRRGMYECAAPHKHRHTDAMGEIGAWLAWLTSNGVKEVVLLGHSRGGNQTAWFALEHDEAVISKIVLMAPMTWNKKGAEESYESEFGEDLSIAAAAAETQMARGQGDALLKDVGFLHCPHAQVSAEAFVDYYRDEPRFHTPTLLKQIQKPVLVIAGGEDATVANLIPAVQALVDGTRVQLRIIDGADHFFRDLHAVEAADHIAAFIGK